MPFAVALSGLNAASSDLSVTANNIANANTTGFKGSRAEFADVWAACQRGGFRLTTVNWHLTGEEAAYIVTDCEAKLM